MKSKLGIVLFLLSLLFSLVMVLPVARAEENYTITGSELSRLNEILTRLDELNKTLSGELIESKKSLSELMNELDSYKAELIELEKQLQILKSESITLKEQLLKAQDLLLKAKESFEIYRRGVEKEIRRLKIQRNLAWIVTIISLYLSSK